MNFDALSENWPNKLHKFQFSCAKNISAAIEFLCSIYKNYLDTKYRILQFYFEIVKTFAKMMHHLIEKVLNYEKFQAS